MCTVQSHATAANARRQRGRENTHVLVLGLVVVAQHRATLVAQTAQEARHVRLEILGAAERVVSTTRVRKARRRSGMQVVQLATCSKPTLVHRENAGIARGLATLSQEQGRMRGGDPSAHGGPPAGSIMHVDGPVRPWGKRSKALPLAEGRTRGPAVRGRY